MRNSISSADSSPPSRFLRTRSSGRIAEADEPAEIEGLGICLRTSDREAYPERRVGGKDFVAPVSQEDSNELVQGCCYRRKPSGSSFVMDICSMPDLPRKRMTASGPNSKITWRQAPQGAQGPSSSVATATAS